MKHAFPDAAETIHTNLLAFYGSRDTLLSPPVICVFFPRANFAVCAGCPGVFEFESGYGAEETRAGRALNRDRRGQQQLIRHLARTTCFFRSL